MGILEILILVAIAVVIFIVIRRLPDTVPNQIKKSYSMKPKARAGVSGFGTKLSGMGNWFAEKVQSAGGVLKSKKKEKTPKKTELVMEELKKPEDREFWKEDDGIKSANRPDLIARTYFEEAETAFKMKDYRKAETLYIEAARENPRNVKVFNRLGVIYLEQKNYEDAIEAFKTAVKYDDKVCTRYYNLALAYIGQGSYKEAGKNLQEAIKLSPDNSKYKQVLEQIEKKC